MRSIASRAERHTSLEKGRDFPTDYKVSTGHFFARLRPGRPFESHSLRPKKDTPKRAFFLAERMGFEPMADCSVTGFQDRLLKPLGHLSN